MTASAINPRQKRLLSCVLPQPKWTKIRKKHRHHARAAFKTGGFTANNPFSVENLHEAGQNHHNTTLLGKYRIVFKTK